MSTAAAIVTLNAHSPAATSAGARLVEAFLAGRRPHTLEAYRKDLEGFRGFLGAHDVAGAAELLLGRGQGAANELVLGYRARMVDAKLAPATINRRLAAIRSMVKLARTLGMVPWTLEVANAKAQSYRDTSGPGVAGFKRLLAVLEGRADPKAIRDRAILRLLFDLGLRRGEVVGLDVADVDLAAGAVEILGKGRTAKERLTLPAPTSAALRAWIAVRDSEPGPLFVNFDRASKGGRLTGTSLYRMVRELGATAGLAVRPHGLRHAAITEALDATGGDVRAVQRFSRHRDMRILLVYDDNRRDLAGDVAALVAERAS